ncbi:type IV pilus assembly PilZ [Pseudomonas sp. M47T1]|uniref:PilZ domain-containing protein n=1 Tax=unclassified Pseudomonas TaxID=196821 RepID=UPI000260758F|nr:PilZ domain-containing protein [Pseudomonas sp. M47T1]EIK96681.1 type IV pilus assembly PilZ [Pseudomonas sp. M47T1]
MSQIDRDFAEKRDFIRMTVNAKVFVLVDGQRILGVCRDLSSTGMQIEARSSVRVGDIIGVHLPSEHAALRDLEAQVEVVRVEELGAGLQTLGLTILQMS